MRINLVWWATAVGAIPRITDYYERIRLMNYYERLRFCNTVFGPDWMFRLHDLVGAERITSTRPSWLAFYRDDIYHLHMPLDPRAPRDRQIFG